MIADITAALEQVREWRERGATIPIPEDNKATDAYVIAVVARDRYDRLFFHIGLKLVEVLGATQQIVDEQAEDEGLWFVTNDAATAYLQQELRRLHKQIEDRQALTEFAEEVERLR